MTAASVAANLGGVALATVPGLGLTEMLAPLRRLPWPRRLAYAFLLGVATLGGCLFAASHLAGVPLHRPLILWASLAPAALGVAVALVRRWRHRGAPPPPGRPRVPGASPRTPRRKGRHLRLVLALAAAVVLTGPLVSALTGPLVDWDGRMTWGALSSYMRQEGTVDAQVLRDARWLILHPRYPPLLPLAQEAIQELFDAGQDDQYFRALYVAFLAALLAVVFDGARRAAGRRAAELAVVCAALPPFLSYGSGGATSAYSDMPLAAYYGGALVLLLCWRPRAATGFAAGCLLAAAVLSKNEGTFLAAAALLLAASRLWSGGSRRTAAGGRHLAWLAAAALPVLAATALLASWRAAIPNREDEDYFGNLQLGELLHGAASRLPLVAWGTVRLTFSPTAWMGFWAAFVVVVAIGRRALARPLAWRLALAGLVPLAVGFAAYAVSLRPSPLMDETWQRFQLQGLVPAAIVFACALGPLLAWLDERRHDSPDPDPEVRPGLAQPAAPGAPVRPGPSVL